MAADRARIRPQGSLRGWSTLMAAPHEAPGLEAIATITGLTFGSPIVGPILLAGM